MVSNNIVLTIKYNPLVHVFQLIANEKHILYEYSAHLNKYIIPELFLSDIKKQLNNVFINVKEPLRGYSTLPILGLVARDRSSLEIVITNFIEKLELDSTKPIKVL